MLELAASGTEAGALAGTAIASLAVSTCENSGSTAAPYVDSEASEFLYDWRVWSEWKDWREDRPLGESAGEGSGVACGPCDPKVVDVYVTDISLLTWIGLVEIDINGQ